MEAMAEMVIRAAREDDVAALAELAGHLGYPVGEDEMRGRMARISAHPDYHTLVAEREGRVIAMAGLMRGMAHHRDGWYARLIELVVSPHARGGGAGARMMEACEAWARRVGAGSLHLTTASRRDDAHRFYRGLGYQATGVRFYKKLEEGVSTPS
jgi:GNAT superfamily N-acetyltransferase